MTAPQGRLVAVDGVGFAAIRAAAREAVARAPRRARAAISWWDASGSFGELAVADASAGIPSARTLLLLYAADLVFRLRWEIRPALAEGRVVVAAPYVDTAAAFGRSAGIPDDWITDLFGFAPKPDTTLTARADPKGRGTKGFVEISCRYLTEGGRRNARKRIEEAMRAHFDRPVESSLTARSVDGDRARSARRAARGSSAASRKRTPA
jgi:thymidylate kinase